MADFSINEMLEMQRRLQENYRGRWEPIKAEAGKHKLLWMIGEVGEVIDIVKITEPLRRQGCGTTWWKSWRMSSCTIMTSCCAMALRRTS